MRNSLKIYSRKAAYFSRKAASLRSVTTSVAAINICDHRSAKVNLQIRQDVICVRCCADFQLDVLASPLPRSTVSKVATRIALPAATEPEFHAVSMWRHFCTSRDLRGKLIASDGRLLVEDVTARGRRVNNLFWGALRALDEDCPLGYAWEGRNMLGRLWIEERAMLQALIS